ncbi:hypothetical protein SDC9_110175 [bioreactor metagenome]|uniref:Uncharacterized protein n=1 Tax=bioreactor metagenome TaxID=1076179 RepID=A0A645BCW9_9ZZZZ
MQPDPVELVGDRVLLWGGGDEEIPGLLALGPVGADDVGDLGAVPVAADDQPFDLLGAEPAVGGHGGRFEQADQLRERLLPAVVRGRGGQDQRVGARGEDAGQPVVLGGGVGDVVRLVDDHRVPAVAAQVVGEPVLLQRVDRDDHPPVEGERVAGRRQLLLHPLHAHRVETYERQREARPHLVLHLLQDMARADDEDPVAAAAADQLGEDHADLESLAQTDRVGEQDAGSEVVWAECLADGGSLVGEGVGEHLGGDDELVVAERDWGLAERRLEPQLGAAVAGGTVRGERGLRRIEDLDVVERLVEARGGALDQRAEALDVEELPVVGLVDGGDQPLLVADHHRDTWGDDGGGGGRHGVSGSFDAAEYQHPTERWPTMYRSIG